MNKKAVAWLYQQLPELIDKGILTTESAERIREYYGPATDNTGNRTFLLIFGVIGALLVGLGIILILAHNWEQLTKLQRLMIAVGLLAISQIIAGCVLWFKRDSLAWREASATLLTLMIGAALAMVGQTYHLVEDVEAFLLTWMVLSLPVLYLMNSTAAAILYLLGVTSWISNQHGNHLVWLLFGAVLPYYRGLLISRSKANATVIISWVINLCFYFIFGAVFSAELNKLGLLVYSALFALTYLLGAGWFKEEEYSGRMPFKVVGLAGSLGITFILTFKDVWQGLALGWHAETMLGYGIAGALLLLTIGANVLLRSPDALSIRRFSLLPCVIGIAYLFLAYEPSGIGAAVILNAYMLLLSISVMASGVQRQSLGIVNMGMLLVVALIVARFFDIDISFVARGIAFVLVGLAFLTANIVLLRRKAGWQHEE
ncbi:MAG: hypothetical protein H6Q72_1622 [Firmicutes bacterium]|nr:hypothetical protein [Bacillota bacterium]